MNETMITTTNCKAVVGNVQSYLLGWVSNYKCETDFAGESNESALVHIIDMYINDYGKGKNRESESWSTPAGVLLHFVEGAMMDVSYFEVNNRLKSWGLNPERYDDDKNWETYIRLVCRDGARLYKQLKRKYTDTCFSGQIISKEWLKNSAYGNPRCKLIITNDKGENLIGNTATNAQCAYIADEGLNALITYHTTKTGKVIIDFINMK